MRNTRTPIRFGGKGMDSSRISRFKYFAVQEIVWAGIWGELRELREKKLSCI
jgi:hypothetical protein